MRKNKILIAGLFLASIASYNVFAVPITVDADGYANGTVLTNAFPKFVWINPEPQGVWQYRQSISVVQQLMNQRMFPLTLAGLEGAMRLLSK